MKKEIKNIVFYTFDSETGKRTQACIFYTDGTVKNTDEAEGLENIKVLMNAKGISPEEFADIIDERYVYRVSGREFEKRFQEFRTKDEIYLEEPEETKKGSFKNFLKTITGVNLINKIRAKHKTKKAQRAAQEDEYEEEEEYEEETTNKKERFMSFLKTITGVKLVSKLQAKYAAYREQKEKEKATKPQKEDGPIKKFFKKTFLGKIARRVAAVATAVAILFIPGCANGKTQRNTDDPVKPIVATADQEYNTDDLIKETTSFAGMLKLSKSETQQKVMTNISATLNNFNIKFANAFVEKGKDIKAALSWDEVISMALVYNDYKKADLIEIFNGAELNATELSDAYKTATLQLMGAHVLETRENQVDISTLLGSDEAKAFYKKYHDLFLACKEATGKTKVEKVNAFYQELYKDFPITEKVREEGIAHSDPRNSIESYKFSIIPMVSASEILFQNLETDKTLQDKAVAYLNDIGVCNRANDIIEKAALVSLMTPKNNEYIDYDLLKEKRIEELKENKAYVIDDAHRDISQLDRFKKQVNVAFAYNGKNFTGTIVSTKTVTEYYTKTTTETTTDRNHAIDVVGLEKVKEAEAKADETVTKENEQARQDAEKKADEEAKRQQEKADQERKEQEEQIKQDEKDFQDKVDKANEDIKNGETVNEKDFGDHDVNFDDKHSDSNGDLNDSVKDITTDPTGDMTDQPLPDPNAEETTKTSDATTSTKKSPATDQNVYEYEEPYTMTNEEKAEAIVEAMANAPTTEKAKVYTYHN